MKRQKFFQRGLTALTALLLLASLLLPGASAMAAPDYVPVPKKPDGNTTDTTPVFEWTKQGSATHYRIQVRKSGSTTPLYTLVIKVADANCGATLCSKEPATILMYLPHFWRVSAKVGGVWGAWSAFKAFNVQQAGFNSQFNGNHTGWTTLNGTWNDGSTYYWSGGQAANYSNTRFSRDYSTFTYEVRMRRNFGVPGNLQGIFFRASSNVASAMSLPSFGLGFANYENGYYSITYGDDTGWWVLLYESSSLINVGSYNTFKVTANGTFLQFFINGTKVVDGYFGFYSSGKVGVFMFDDEGTLQINFATLTSTAPAGSAAEADEAGVIHLGNVTLGSGTPMEP